jgi:hypothetical protein
MGWSVPDNPKLTGKPNRSKRRIIIYGYWICLDHKS